MGIEEELTLAADRFEADRAKVAAQEAAATERRAKVVRKAAAAGLTQRKIAQLARISHQRVQQIVKANGSP